MWVTSPIDPNTRLHSAASSRSTDICRTLSSGTNGLRRDTPTTSQPGCRENSFIAAVPTSPDAPTMRIFLFMRRSVCDQPDGGAVIVLDLPEGGGHRAAHPAGAERLVDRAGEFAPHRHALAVRLPMGAVVQIAVLDLLVRRHDGNMPAGRKIERQLFQLMPRKAWRLLR